MHQKNEPREPIGFKLKNSCHNSILIKALALKTLRSKFVTSCLNQFAPEAMWPKHALIGKAISG